MILAKRNFMKNLESKEAQPTQVSCASSLIRHSKLTYSSYLQAY